MSVDYYILKVDGKEYCDWIAKFNLAALDEEEYEKAIQEKAAISTEVNTALYPPELHSHVAIAIDEIVEAIEKGQVVERERPSASFFGRLIGKSERVKETSKIDDEQIVSFAEFAQMIYWSQIAGASQPNELAIESENLELSLSLDGLHTAAKLLDATDVGKVLEVCQSKRLDLADLNEIMDGGLESVVDGWRRVIDECIREHKALVIEVYG